MSPVEFESPKGFEYHRPTLKKTTETFLVQLLLKTGYIKTRQQAGFVFLAVIFVCIISSSLILLDIERRIPPLPSDADYQAYMEVLNRK